MLWLAVQVECGCMTAEPLPSFQEQFDAKLEVVSDGVSLLAEDLRQEMSGENPHSLEAMEGYISLLKRGGKRWRGVLAVTGYELYQGKDKNVIVAASGAIEGLHAYLLDLDDCADGDSVRRGGPAVHAYISGYLEEQHAYGDTTAGGVHLAITAGTVAQYKALQMIQSLNVPLERRDIAQRLMQTRLMKTGMGQLLDLLGGHVQLNKADILNAARYKTAYYTFLLPLQIGAVLAGAPEEELAYFEAYANNAGLAFQLRDDIIGLFGDSSLTGKMQKSDIASNKQTLLRWEALKRANAVERNMLVAALGNTMLQEHELQNCLQIIRCTGALAEIEQQIRIYTDQALDALDDFPAHWPSVQVRFLEALTLYGVQRQS